MPWKSRHRDGQHFYQKDDPKQEARSRAIRSGKRVPQNKTEIIKQLEQREMKVSSNERYNGWSNWDTWNTMLLLENTERSSKWLDAWRTNWLRKIKGGRFDIAKAESVVHKYLVPAARGAKRFKWAVGEDFTPDEEINPKKIDAAEIVGHILDT